MSSNFSSSNNLTVEDIENRARTERYAGLRVSAVYREIDGKQGFSKDETTMLSRLREEIEKNDENQDGVIDASEMVSALRGIIKSHDQKRVLRQVIYGGVALVVLLVAATFGTGIAVAVLTRKLSSDDNVGKYVGPALISPSTGQMLYTRPKGSSGTYLLIASFYENYVNANGECISYRLLLDIPAEDSPTGQKLQCAGVTPSYLTRRSIKNAAETSSPIHFAYQYEGQTHGLYTFRLPSSNIENFPDMRGVSGTRRLQSDALFNLTHYNSMDKHSGRRRLQSNIGYNATHYTNTAEQEGTVDHMTQISLPIVYQNVEVTNSMIDMNQVIQNNPDQEHVEYAQNQFFHNQTEYHELDKIGGKGEIDYANLYAKDLGTIPGSEYGSSKRRRRRLNAAKAFADPLSAPWYEFMGDTGPPSSTFLCNPDITGDPKICYFCSGDTNIQPVNAPENNNNMTTP